MTEKIENSAVLEITQVAVDKIVELIANRGKGPQAIRVAVRGMPNGTYQSDFMFVAVEDRDEVDVVQNAGPFPLYFDETTAASLQGAKVDFDEVKYPSGFGIEYSQNIGSGSGLPKKEWDDPVAIAVQKVVDEQINPGIAGHGGWVALLDVKGDTAHIEMGGGCRGCAISNQTLKQGIERTILDNVPEIKQVLDSTDHAGGANPYYK